MDLCIHRPAMCLCRDISQPLSCRVILVQKNRAFWMCCFPCRLNPVLLRNLFLKIRQIHHVCSWEHRKHQLRSGECCSLEKQDTVRFVPTTWVSEKIGLRFFLFALSSTVEQIYQKKTQLEHILLRPDTYIGSTETVTQPMWVFDDAAEKMVNRLLPCHFLLLPKRSRS
jgi:hypothetical protein